MDEAIHYPGLPAKPSVVCWGNWTYGQTTPPASVNGTSGKASAIAAGENHSCAIQAGTGAVVCWGADTFAQSTSPSTLDGVTGRPTAIVGHTVKGKGVSFAENTYLWHSNNVNDEIFEKALGELE